MRFFPDASEQPMTLNQETYLLRLIEKLDSVPEGSYSEHPFGPMSKKQASDKIDLLSSRLEARKLRRMDGSRSDRLNNVRSTGQDAAD